MIMKILAPWITTFEAQFELEKQNAALRRRLADALMDSDKATLEGLAALIRLQALTRTKGRDDANEPIPNVS